VTLSFDQLNKQPEIYTHIWQGIAVHLEIRLEKLNYGSKPNFPIFKWHDGFLVRQ
jgi:hypothetical protein